MILSVGGLQRLRAAQYQSEIRENYSDPYTLEDLSERSNLSPNTIAKIQRRRVPVDRGSIESYFNAFNLTLTEADYTLFQLDNRPNRQRLALKGQVPLDSPFYVERLPIELQCYETIIQPGALIRIKASKQMGKTSLMARILQHARGQRYQTVVLNLQLADATVLTDLSRFLQWFCAIATRSLGLDNRVADDWDEMFGSNYNCTDYFEKYLLPALESPLVLVLDEADVVFNYPEVATDFFGLLRAWYEQAQYGDSRSEIWQKLRLVVVHSTEVYIPLNLNQSPFNVGLSIELPEFTPEQVQDLANRYLLDWGEEEVTRLMQWVGGKPYLVQTALHHLSTEAMTLDRLATEVTADSIYEAHLRHLLWQIEPYPELMNALMQVVMSPTPVELEPVQAFKLQSLGVVKRQGEGYICGCQLYCQYFRDRLSRLQVNPIQDTRLATLVSTNVVDFAAKMAANPEQTQTQLYRDFQLMTQLTEQFEGQVIKLIEDSLLIYFPSAVNAVNCAQGMQLALQDITQHLTDSPLTHRIGIYFGEAVFNCIDITGVGIDLAKRIQAEAPPGGICLSHEVYEVVRDSLSLEPLNLGERQFEGIELPISLYQLTV